jgi:cytochrome b involved in lipid metabolism
VSGTGDARVVISTEQLQHSKGDAAKLRLAILGEVYDVTAGRRHYGKDGGYSFFAGRDASRAYVTGLCRGTQV